MAGSVHPIDRAVVVMANLMNLLLAGMFLARASGTPGTPGMPGTPHLARSMGSAGRALPLAVAAALNIVWQRGMWLVILPALLVVYCAVEFALDYVWKIDFRSTALLGPYLGLYYLSLMGMIGYAFMAAKPLGFVTLVTYFANLAATFHSLPRVGHGQRQGGRSALNRGHAAHLSMSSCSALARRPRCLGGCQRGGGTWYSSTSPTLQQWSVSPAAMAGVGRRPH